MKNSEKNSSKQATNNVNNETLSPDAIKAQLKAACANMNAKETKEYIKGLDGYELRLTGQKPTQHYTVFCGDIRICNVEQVQGIKADGTARGCVSVAKVNFIEKIEKTYTDIRSKIFNDMTDDEKIDSKLLFEELKEASEKIQSIFDSCNNRIAEQAKEAAKAKRAEAAKERATKKAEAAKERATKKAEAAKERATKKVGEKIAAGTDSEKIAAIAAALNVSYEVAATIYKEQKQTA